MNDSSVKEVRYSEALANEMIEDLVMNIIQSHEAKTPCNSDPLRTSLLNDCFTQLQNSIDFFGHFHKSEHYLSPYVETFWRGCAATGITQGNIHNPVTEYCDTSITLDRTQNLINWILVYANSPQFKLKVKTYLDRFYDNEELLAEFANHQLRKHKKTLVVRLNLGFKTEIHNKYRIKDVFQLLKKFHYQNKNPIFNGLIGHVWSINQDVESGYQIQCVYLFNGEECLEGAYIANKIGMLWLMSTGEHAAFFNFNNEADVVKNDLNSTSGIGLIHQDNPEEYKHAFLEMIVLANIVTGKHLRSIPFNHKYLGIIDI